MHPKRRIGLRLLALLVLLVLSVACGKRDAARTDPEAERINTQKSLAFDHLMAGNYQAAVDILQPLSEQRVKDPQLYSMLAKAQWKLGAYQEAVGNYESSLRLDYSAGDVHLEFGEMLMGQGKIGRALTEFELGVQLDPRNPLAHYNYGLTLYKLNRRDEALAQWEQAHSLDGANPLYAQAMGIGLSGVDDNRALEFFAKAGYLGADGPTYHNNFGLLLKRLGQNGRAETEFKKALELEPNNDAFRLNLAAVYMNTKRYAESITLWETLLAGSPDKPSYRIYLARAYYEEGRFEDTIDLLEDWLADAGGNTGGGAPGLDEGYDLLAMSCRGVGKLDKAVLYITKALDIQPDSVMHLNNYGVILAENGMLAKAKAQWTKVLQLEPDNAVARENLSAFDK